MALHEIGYLIIGGALQCWFGSAVENSCPNAEKVKPAGITREKIGDFETREVHYEESGFAVFKREDDIFEIRKKNGDKSQIRLSELNRQIQIALPKTVSAEEVKNSLWRYESLEEIFKGAMISHESDFLPLLRKDDLKTPLNIPKEQLESVRQDRINRVLKASQFSIPIGYIVTSVPCTYKKINANTTASSCAAPGKVPAYARPDRNSEKILEEQGDWIRMKLVVLEKSKRIVWFNKKDIPYKMVRLKENEGIKTLIEFLNPNSGSSSEQNSNLAENLKLLSEQPLDLDLDSAGETKWADGILWVKVSVRSEPHCTVEESKPISTGWLPYIEPKTKKKVLKWYSRGR